MKTLKLLKNVQLRYCLPYYVLSILLSLTLAGNFKDMISEGGLPYDLMFIDIILALIAVFFTLSLTSYTLKTASLNNVSRRSAVLCTVATIIIYSIISSGLLVLSVRIIYGRGLSEVFDKNYEFDLLCYFLSKFMKFENTGEIFISFGLFLICVMLIIAVLRAVFAYYDIFEKVLTSLAVSSMIIAVLCFMNKNINCFCIMIIIAVILMIIISKLIVKTDRYGINN